ncbi:MAG: hypothetical protein Q9M28_00695 [Mariprofundaceae bacterium]|nr:hypothetical protein [Mariprofundaceae bacterium]
MSKDNVIDHTYLHQHVDDAQLLLAYASENGLSVGHQISSDILASRYHFYEGTVDQEVEIQFWKAYDQLAQVIQPVSIESLKATKLHPKNHKPSFFARLTGNAHLSQAQHTIRKYQLLTLVVLLVLIMVQVYWLINTKIVTAISYDLPKQSSAIKEKALSEIKTLLIAADSDENHEKIADSLDDLKTLYEDELADIDKSRVAYYQALKVWSLCPESICDTSDFENSGFVMVQQTTKFTLEPIQQYLLPLLYGWLGALAYVLRSLTREISEITYTSESREHYRLRIQLGALSGLAIGWFLLGDSGGQAELGGLSALAISFVAGYSVELLFSVMDKMVESVRKSVGS